jgi:A/G-specific adenine glycosylase
MVKPSAPDSKSKPAADSHAALLLAWYDRARRVLPWRALPHEVADPYRVWLSEVMLQQTTVQAVKPYFETFLRLFPTVESLAAAPTDQVMSAWAGLGYYSRARNLHACAKQVATLYQGQFPQDYNSLKALPGIGDYTASAIMAIAFDQRAVVVDGNVERVIARLFRIEEPLPLSKPAIKHHAGQLTPHQRSGDYAQAMMDLGATLCTPRSPSCFLCPVRAHCAATKQGDEATFPRKLPKKTRQTRYGAAFLCHRTDGAVLLRTRPDKGLLGGMSEIPTTEWHADASDPSQDVDQAPLALNWKQVLPPVQHVFTHFPLVLRVYVARAPLDTQAPEGMRFTPRHALSNEALPNVMVKALTLGLDSL